MLQTKEKFCPKCGTDISDSYEPRDPGAGVDTASWWCEECQLPVEDDESY